MAAFRKQNVVQDVPSPCVQVCQIDQDTGECLGCGRTLDEIAGWSQYSNAQKQSIWDRLERRGE